MFLPYLQMTPAEWTDSALARSNFVQDLELRIGAGAADLESEVRARCRRSILISAC